MNESLADVIDLRFPTERALSDRQVQGRAQSARSLAERVEDEAEPVVARPALSEGDRQLMDVLVPFIENWGTLADSFGMNRDMGRIHAFIYLSPAPVDLDSVAATLSLGRERCSGYLRALGRWGVVTEVEQDGKRGYVAEPDPWTWFVTSIRERRKTEFVPVLVSVRNVRDLARELSAKATGTTKLRLDHAYARIDRFTRFCDDMGKLIDAMTVMGAAPMAKLMRTVAKFMPTRR